MKAIVTTFYGPTDTKPQRIVARAEGVRSITLPNASSEEDHKRAAQSLADKQGWTGALTMAGLPNGSNVHVFTPAVDALRGLTAAVIRNTMREGNPYSRPVVKKALKALASHDGTEDYLNARLDN